MLKQYRHVQKENQQLKKEIEKQQSESLSAEEKLKALQKQAGTAKIGTDGWSTASKKELEKRIDTYLKEIERCLALLNA